MSQFVEDRSVITRAAAPPDAVVHYGELREHIADVRVGKNTPAHRPLVIVIHGGFWRPEHDRTHAGAMCAAVAAAGWTVASIEYRRIPRRSHMTLEDVSLAIEQLPSLVHQHNGNLIVLGHSAGGHLALWAAVKCALPELIGVLALGPVADLQYAYDAGIGNQAVLAFVGGNPTTRPSLDPCRLPSATVKVVIVHGKEDAIAPLAMSERYVARHPATRLARVDDCGHFALIDPLSVAWQQVLAELQTLSQA